MGGRDIVLGSAGNDFLSGGAGADYVYGESGFDHFVGLASGDQHDMQGGWLGETQYWYDVTVQNAFNYYRRNLGNPGIGNINALSGMIAAHDKFIALAGKL
jgi:Ca2+-binding RTX toxin-like protein